VLCQRGAEGRKAGIQLEPGAEQEKIALERRQLECRADGLQSWRRGQLPFGRGGVVAAAGFAVETSLGGRVLVSASFEPAPHVLQGRRQIALVRLAPVRRGGGVPGMVTFGEAMKTGGSALRSTRMLSAPSTRSRSHWSVPLTKPLPLNTSVSVLRDAKGSAASSRSPTMSDTRCVFAAFGLVFTVKVTMSATFAA